MCEFNYFAGIVELSLASIYEFHIQLRSVKLTKRFTDVFHLSCRSVKLSCKYSSRSNQLTLERTAFSLAITVWRTNDYYHLYLKGMNIGQVRLGLVFMPLVLFASYI